MKKGGKHTPEAIARISAGKKNPSSATRKKLSDSLKGRKLSPDHCANIGKSRIGKKQSPEWIAKRVAANTGKKRSPEVCEKMSKAQQNRSPETRANMSIAAKKRGPVSEETRRKMSEAHKGYKQSPEHIENVRLSRKGYKHSPETLAKMKKTHKSGMKGKKHSPETIAKMRAAKLGKVYSEEAKKNMRLSHLGKSNPPHSAATRKKMSKARTQAMVEGRVTTNKHFKNGWYFSPKAGRVWHRSSLELAWFKRFDADDNILRYFVEPCSIPYKMARTRRYVPDVLLQTTTGWVLAEIKPETRKDEEINQRKIAAGASFAAEQGWDWEVLTEEVA